MFPSASTLVTANPGGGQAKAASLSADFNFVNIVASVGDSVKLPPAGSPVMCVVINNTANAMNVFPSGLTDIINNLAPQTSINQPAFSMDIYVSGLAGQWFVEPGVGFAGSLFTESAVNNLVAYPGGGQANATLVTTQTVRVSAVATAGDSIKLPPAAPGLEIVIINRGGNTVAIYGSGTDTIDELAANAFVTQMNKSMVIFSCTGTGQWYTNGLNTGYSGNFPTVSFKNNLTATPAGTQATSLLIGSVINRFTTVATANDSCLLPLADGGISLTITNAAASSVNVFPAVGDAINGLAANAPYPVAGGKTVALSSAGPGFWHAVLGA